MRIPISGQPIRLPILLLVATEAAATCASPFLAVTLLAAGRQSGTPNDGALWVCGVSFACLMILGLIATGLYSERQRARARGISLRVITSAVFAFIILELIAWFEPALSLDCGTLGVIVTLGMGACLIVRAASAKLLDEPLFKRRVLIYGAGTRAGVFARLRRRADRRGFTIVGFIPAPGETPVVPADMLLPSNADLLEICRRLHVDEIIVAMDDRRVSFPREALLRCRLSGIEVIDLQTFLERETGKLRLDVIDPSWMIFGAGFRRQAPRVLIERLFDLFACAALFVLTWPLMLLVSIAIKIEDGPRAPVSYRQRRVGFNGLEFEMLKFRSMDVDAERAGSAQWTAEDDPRVTRVGRFIRKMHIDELPQLFNVLKGDMTMVGPRPERPEFVKELSEKIPYYRERHFVKPGITGWAQLCFSYGASESDAMEKLQYDLYYVKNHCFLFDLSILLQTAEVVMSRKGAR